MATISLCVITKNEQGNIARCLCSVKNYVAEMIVVDTGSSDDTVSIAQSLGAKVFHYNWDNNFAAARNFALDQAIGDWIVFLDADEYFEQGTSSALPEIVKKNHGNRKIDAVCITMKHMESLSGPVIANTYLVRLFRHSRLIRYRGRIHEAIHKQGRSPVAIYIPESTLVIHHTGYSESNLPEKARRNLPLLEQDVAENTLNCLTYYHISQSYILLQNYEQAAHYALKALENNEEILLSNAQYKPYVYYIKSMIFLNLHSQEKVIAMVKSAWEKYPDHPEILHCIGMYHLKCGRYSRALEFLLQALEANVNYHSTLDNEFPKLVGQVQEEIAVLHAKMNHVSQAFDYTIGALKSDKYLGSSLALLLSQVKTQKPADIVQVLDSLYSVQNKADVAFLVRNLAVLNQKQLFAHYLKLLSTQFQENYFIGMKFLICDKYEAAFHCFAALAEHSNTDGAELFALIACMLAERPDWLANLASPPDSPMQKIGSLYFQLDTEADLPDMNSATYSTLVLNFIHLSSEEQLFRLLRLSSHFSQPDTALKVLDHLIKYHVYSPVFRFCLEQLQTTITPDLFGQYSVRAGFCCYKTKDWEHAVVFFRQALAQETSRRAAVELLTWSYQQCRDPIIRPKIESIYAQYNLDLALLA
jgi:glycosyltransferase involved in cell wall biosynthesis